MSVPWGGIPEAYRNQVVTGDARELARALPDESVDLVFTDPPYPREFLPLYGWLAEEAARVLKPGGSCLTIMPQAYADIVLPAMTRHLDYHWLNCMYQPTVTNTARFWPKQIYIHWKPVLWLTKGKRELRRFVDDGVTTSVRDKRFHAWGQNEQWAFYWLDQIGWSGSVTWDPFCGGGTVPAVCKQLGRQWVAFEIDPETATLARERVRLTPEPLLVLDAEPQQLTLEVP